MIKRIFAFLLSAALMLCGIEAFAQEYCLETDFTGSSGTKAAGFEKWYKGASYGAALGKLYAETGIFGNDDDNTSVRIESPERAKTDLKIYLEQSVSLAGDFAVGARLAAADKNAVKSITLGVIGADGEKNEINAIELSTDGMIYCFGEELCTYSTDRWYGIELESTDDRIDVYLNGELYKKISPRSIGEITYIRCLLTKKTDQLVAAQMYADDVYLKSGTVRESSRIDISSEVFDIDSDSHTISNIPKGTDVQGFLDGIETSCGEKLAIVDANGAMYSDRELTGGLYLSVSSSDGVNRVSYYLDTMGLALSGISNGEILRTSNMTLGIDGNIPETVESVRYFVNGKAIATVSEAPYATEYEFKSEGVYEIYAVVTISGQDYNTPTVTVTYSPNKQPTAKMNLSGDVELTYGDALSVEVTAADEDGEIAECVLVIDGVEYTPQNDSSPYKFTVEKLAVGTHKVYARALDNEGAVGESEKINVNVTRSGRNDISVCNFNGGSSGDWVLWGSNVAASYSQVRDDYGLSYTVNIGEAATARTTAAVVFASSSGLFSQATINAECDIMIDDTENSTIDLFILNSKSGQFDTAYSIRNGSIGGKTIEPGSWHHFMYSFNLANKTASLYMDGELVEARTGITTDGTFNNMRFNVSNSSSEKTINFYLDNAEIYAAMEYPYVKSVAFLDENGKDVAKSDDIAGADVNKIVLNFNTQLDSETVIKDNFSLMINDRAYDMYDVSAEENSGHTDVILTLRGAAVTSSQCKVLISGNVADRFAQSSGEVQTAEFKISPAALDVTEWSVYCGNKRIQQSGDIKKGDELTVTAEFANSGRKNGKVWLIMAIYNGSELQDYRIKEIDSASYGSSFKVSERFAINDVSKGISVEGYVWSADMLSAKSAYFELAR